MSDVNARALARNSLHMQAVQLAQMASRLVLTPIMLARLGLEGYGVWVLLFSLGAYATALNTGVVWAYVKLTAELDERQEYALLSQVVSSGAVLMAAAATIVLGAVWLLRGILLPAIGVPPPALYEAQLALAVLSAAVLVDTSLGAALPVLAGLQRMDLQYRFILVGSLADFVTALTMLSNGYGVLSLASGFLAGKLVAGGVAFLVCRRLRPALVLAPWRARLAALRRLMPLGFRLQGVVLLYTLARESVRLLISTLFGAAALGTYQLADRVLFFAKSPVGAILSPLMPAFSGLAARGQTERGRALFAQASTVTAAGAALSLLFAAMFADPILRAWTGHDIPNAAWTVRVLAPAEFAALLTGVAVAALRAAGTVGLELRFALAASVLALVAVAVGYPIAGYAGSVVAIAVGRCVAATWFLRRLPLAWTVDRRDYAFRTLVWSVVTVTPVVLAAKLVSTGLPDSAGRWMTLATIALLGAASALAVAAMTWLVLLSKEDRAALRDGW